MHGRFSKKEIIKYTTYILLINFINLTANFYQVSSLDDTLLKYEDPYDSVAELVLEYILDMDDETVPDTELPEDKRKILDINSLLEGASFQIIPQQSIQIISDEYFSSDMYKNIALAKISPPPKS